MRMVHVNGVRYFIDSVPGRKWEGWTRGDIYGTEHFYAVNDVNIFFAKHVSDDDFVSRYTHECFPKNQPSENTVRSAMIWSYGEDYKIKSGGGAMSDHCYSASFVNTIADPVTGHDKDVVLIKKYSTSFRNVLITHEELEQLEELTMSPAKRKESLMDDIGCVFREIGRYTLYLEGKIQSRNFNNGKPFPIEKIIQNYRLKFKEEDIREYFERLDRRKNNVYSNDELNSIQNSISSAIHRGYAYFKNYPLSE